MRIPLLAAIALAGSVFALASCASGGCGCGHKNDLGRDTSGPRVVQFVDFDEAASPAH